jgi:flagellar biosynthesis anti-sigma factor FlgM
MKIQSLPPIAPVESQAPSTGRAAPEKAGDPATKVSLSKDAAFVDEMREKASPAPFRADLVAEIKAQVQAGTFEATVDPDRVVDGLMAGL